MPLHTVLGAIAGRYRSRVLGASLCWALSL
jgi:hypothetical protein